MGLALFWFTLQGQFAVGRLLISDFWKHTMEAELLNLEDKVQQLAALCRQLRNENRQLRQDLLQTQQENQQLNGKLAGAKDRLASLLAKLPEELA